MTIGSHDDYVKYRFHRAEETFEEALILAENGKWNAVVNRLYYACFYAVIALLLKNKIETQSHEGARTQFGLLFIKTGRIDRENGKLFTKCLTCGKREIMVICLILMKKLSSL